MHRMRDPLSKEYLNLLYCTYIRVLTGVNLFGYGAVATWVVFRAVHDERVGWLAMGGTPGESSSKEIVI